MSEHQSENLIQSLRERNTWQAVGTQGRPVAAPLKLDETNRTLGLLDDETDSRDEEWAAPLAQAADFLQLPAAGRFCPATA